MHGELLKLGYVIGHSTVRDLRKRQHIALAPERAKNSNSWRNLLSHYGQQLLACDFFTVETAWLKTLHALFFIELGSRRVHFAGCTEHPSAEWVAQQARQLTWTLQDVHKRMRFLIHDRDAKFPTSFDRVFAAEGIEILRTPYQRYCQLGTPGFRMAALLDNRCMTTSLATADNGHRFPHELSAPAVWRAFRFPLSYRPVAEILAARGRVVR